MRPSTAVLLGCLGCAGVAGQEDDAMARMAEEVGRLSTTVSRVNRRLNALGARAAADSAAHAALLARIAGTDSLLCRSDAELRTAVCALWNESDRAAAAAAVATASTARKARQAGFVGAAAMLVSMGAVALVLALRAGGPRPSAPRPRRAPCTDAARAGVPAAAEPDHTLACALGLELFRLKARIAQGRISAENVSAAARRLEDELGSRGYTIGDMTGRPYCDGMTVPVVNFIATGTGEGPARIGRTVRPEICHRGVVIDPGAVEVIVPASDDRLTTAVTAGRTAAVRF